MKLLIVTQAVDLDDPILGFFHRWIEEFAGHTEKISVICLREGVHNLPTHVSVYSLGKEIGVSRLKYIRNFYRYAWTLRHEYDAVFVHMNPEYVVLGGLIWRLTGKKVALWFTHKSVTWYLRIAIFFANTVFTASAESFRLGTRKRQIMGHGIPVDRFPAHDAESSAVLRICTLGRVSDTKRVREMVQAVQMLNQTGVPCRLSIAGSAVTDRERVYEQQIRAEFADARSVSFVGPIAHAQVPAFMRNADLCINLSATGSLDKAVLEAFAAGVPVLSSNEAFREALAPFDLFVASSDSADVSEAIGRFALRSDRKEVGERLRAYVQERHSLHHLISCIMAWYDSDTVHHRAPHA